MARLRLRPGLSKPALRAARRGTPFILGVADQVPPNGELDFCRRISDLVRFVNAEIPIGGPRR
ncbi:MAG TPA: hypothetical protein VMZ50_08060 [Phycisphaerae bacterium]|nr:hypothetical protein [Phycisphaerae bacterium]